MGIRSRIWRGCTKGQNRIATYYYADKRILDTPAPIIVLGSLSASSVDITVRVWVKTADYWNVLYDINEIVYTTFNKEGIGFPFPQLTVHQSSK